MHDTPLILVVEDNESQQKMIKLLEQRCHYRAQIVSSCEEMMDVISLTPLSEFALVLMDWKLKGDGHDGLSCTKLIRQVETGSGLRIPIIAMTAYAMEGDKETCLEAGMDDYLSKPFTIGQFESKLNQWLQADNVKPFRPTLVKEKTGEEP
jgi:CheY-like chemotaxis protein